MSQTTFVNTITLTDAGWFNDVDALTYPPSLSGSPLTYAVGTFTATVATGLTTTPTATWSYTRIGNLVTLNVTILSGTSNATGFTISGLPAAIQPATIKRVPARTQDNGASEVWGMLSLTNSGTVTVYPNANADNWTNSGAKALDACSVSYTLV